MNVPKHVQRRRKKPHCYQLVSRIDRSASVKSLECHGLMQVARLRDVTMRYGGLTPLEDRCDLSVCLATMAHTRLGRIEKKKTRDRCVVSTELFRSTMLIIELCGFKFYLDKVIAVYLVARCVSLAPAR